MSHWIDHVRGRVTIVWDGADNWQRWALVGLAMFALMDTLFVIAYASRPWWRVAPGRAVFLKAAQLCAVLWLSLVGTFFVYPYHEPVAAFVLWLGAAVSIYQLVVLLRTPRRPSR